MLKKTENMVIAVLAVAVIVLAYMNFGGVTAGGLSATEASETALTFINNYMLEPGNEAVIIGEVVEDKGLYKFNIEVGGQEVSSYVTKDGTMLFPQGGVDLTEVEENQDAPEGSPQTVTPTYDANSHIRGNFEAPITIIEFSDFQCSFCARFHDTMKEVAEAYPTQVKWVYKHFPLDSIHPYARKASEASECASDQNKFWEYTDGLYAGQSEITPEFLKELAKEIALDAVTFDECLDSGKYADKVEADYQEGIAAGVSGTPGSFINGELLGGAVPFSSIESKIEGILSETSDEVPSE
ncbi:MAG: DsbA family protein [Parcubacteria group bacterium]|nr:DsbA family protein [Parcubacteria group bacterium]